MRTRKYAIGCYNSNGTKKSKLLKKRVRRNKTYKKRPTKYRVKCSLNQAKVVVKAVMITVLFITVYQIATATNSIYIDGGIVSHPETIKQVIPQLEAEKLDPPVVFASDEVVREVTAYNAGDPYQCDNTPCISASGDNICTLLAQGVNVCATNKEPIGTKLEIEGLGICIVLDRMNSRYTDRIDWAMKADEKPQAIAFGVKDLKVKTIK